MQDLTNNMGSFSIAIFLLIYSKSNKNISSHYKYISYKINIKVVKM